MKLKKRFMTMVLALISFLLILAVINISATNIMRRSFNRVAYEITPKIITLNAIESSAGRLREETISYMFNLILEKDAKTQFTLEEKSEIYTAMASLQGHIKTFKTHSMNRGSIQHTKKLPKAVSSLIQNVDSIVQEPNLQDLLSHINFYRYNLEMEEEMFLSALNEAYQIENIILNQRKEESKKIFSYSVFSNLIFIILFGTAGVVYGIRLTFYMLNPIGALNEALKAVAKGDFSQKITLNTGDEFEEMAEEFNKMVTQLSETHNEINNAKSRIEESLQEKEMLLREIHHRVKNNLQVVISLIRLQAIEIDDEFTRKNLMEIQERIKAMALIHKSLYLSDNLSAINMKDYIQRLVQNQRGLYGSDNYEICMELDEVYLNIDKAIPCGLIINELLVNAIKHAFPDDKKGIITIEISENKTIRITVRDNGIGHSDEVRTARQESLGLKLVSALSDQLRGNISVNNESGMHHTLEFTKSQDG